MLPVLLPSFVDPLPVELVAGGEGSPPDVFELGDGGGGC